MVGARTANLKHGQKKADTAIAVTQPEAAKLINISEDSIQRARKVQEEGVPELVQAVDTGEIAEVYHEASADLIVEVAHLPNEPWHKTLQEKGENKRIDFLRAIDDRPGSLSYEEAKHRMEEIAETYNVFGAE
jgi:hypothetical protein